METKSETVTVDKIRHYNNQYETFLYEDDDEVYRWERLRWDGPIDVEAAVSFDEYYTTLEGDFEVTIEWTEYEDDNHDESIQENFYIVEVESL